MKVLCILQNAWGPRQLPMIFRPNPLNKSAKRMHRICDPHVMHFSNTTMEMTTSPKGKPKPDIQHVKMLLGVAKEEYDVVIVCGRQAKECVASNMPDGFAPLVLYMQHPASRSLTNVECDDIKERINLFYEASRIKTQE